MIKNAGECSLSAGFKKLELRLVVGMKRNQLWGHEIEEFLQNSSDGEFNNY